MPGCSTLERKRRWHDQHCGKAQHPKRLGGTPSPEPAIFSMPCPASFTVARTFPDLK
jgi:hypothetical protein